MSLSDLPREILLDVADYLGDTGMNALARTNSQVYHLLNPLLYRRDITKPESKSLIWGAEYGVEGTIQQAIDAGQNLTPISKSFQTALQVAIDSHQEYARLVELFLQVDDINPGNHLLGTAASRGHVNIFKLLLDYPGTDPNFAERDGRTALMRAYKPEVVKILLEQADIEINRQDDLGCTALSHAAHHSYSNSNGSSSSDIEIAKLLLEREDIDANLPESNGWTALHWACHNGCLALVDLLLEKDIDPNSRDNLGRTPLAHVCHYSCGSVAIVRSLLSHPSTDPNAINNNGVSILVDHTTSKASGFISPNNEIESLLRAAGAT
jgi:ankyrin repeat protein